MRKKFMQIPVCVCVALLIVFALSGAVSAGDKVIELSYSTFFPLSHSQGAVSQMYCEEINKRTNGRVKMTLFPGGTLSSATKIYEGVTRGISDLGWAVPTYTPGRFEFSDALAMPRVSKTAWVTSRVAADAYKNFRPKAYEDVKLLIAVACPPYTVGTPDKPVRKPEDLQGVKIRAGGAVASAFAKQIGAVPQAMPMGETYEAMAKGVINALLTPAETQKGFKHADVTKYLTILPLSFSTDDLVVMNKKKWNSLPKDIQKIFEEVSAEFEELHRRAWWYSTIEGIEYFKSKGEGREVVEIPDSETQVWGKYLNPLKEDFLKEAKKKNLPGQEWVDYMDERAEYWNANHPEREAVIEWGKKSTIFQ